MEKQNFASAYVREMISEHDSTRKCLERIPESIWDFKPHPKSMEMGYLTQLVGEIPRWIQHIVENPELDLATFEHLNVSHTRELVSHFEESFEGAVKALDQISDEELQQSFELKANGKVMMTSTKFYMVGSTINHWVHQRGQLTVYMRLNDVLVPSIYGPSADDKNF
jgi:uncharacterized damage-inducible protein DinB